MRADTPQEFLSFACGQAKALYPLSPAFAKALAQVKEGIEVLGFLKGKPCTSWGVLSPFKNTNSAILTVRNMYPILKHMFKSTLCTWVVILMLPAGLMAQSSVERIKLRLQFDKDQHSLREAETQKLQRAFEGIGDCEVIKIYINGHTDNDADADYNLKLSRRRVETVSDFLVDMGYSKRVQQLNFFGESKPAASNEEETGQKVNRRVDVIIKYLDCTSQVPPVLKPEPKPELPDTCMGRDTTIVLESGTEIEMNRCQFLEVKDCITINEYNDPNTLGEEGISTESDDGVVMASCGMVNITLNPPCPRCLDYPMKVRFPVNNDCEVCPMRTAASFVMDANGTWSSDKKTRFKTVTIKGKEYYEIKTSCGDFYNCDCKICTIPIKVKSSRDVDLDNVRLVFNCPIVSTGRPKKRRTHKQKFRIPYRGYDYVQIWAESSDRFGVVMKVDGVNGNDLVRKRRFPFRTICINKAAKRKYRIKKYPKSIYRVYKIRSEDWEVK